MGLPGESEVVWGPSRGGSGDMRAWPYYVTRLCLRICRGPGSRKRMRRCRREFRHLAPTKPRRIRIGSSKNLVENEQDAPEPRSGAGECYTPDSPCPQWSASLWAHSLHFQAVGAWQTRSYCRRPGGQEEQGRRWRNLKAGCRAKSDRAKNDH